MEVARRHVDLVLLDLLMPKVDGWAVFEQLLQMSGPRPKVIFLTAVDSSGPAAAAIKLGAEDWITKPFDESSLLMQIRALLQPGRIIVQGGELGARGTIGVLSTLRCGLSAEYRSSGHLVFDAASAACETGMAALLSQPPINLTALSKVTAAALHHVSTKYPGVNVDGLAHALGLSTNYLLQLFRQDLGLTPRDYIARVRVEVIKQRLRLPECPSLERLAEEVGLCDGPHLSRVFRRYVQAPPGLYRGNIQDGSRSVH
jgi:YesN/AraC family two-component response regulator